MAKIDKPWQAIGLVSVIGVDMAVCVIAGVWIGKYMDGLFGTKPWLLLAGLLVGLGVGLYSVYRLIRAYF
ncbi:AtpZ/AtpI family protein [Brevibacillus massiliensis]|uniref:AtpZ/AtpI family protein n=1 Tax=Brevibacillus massiliensis TaxID=1118054 RepID=UPI000314EE50|nr:AtpZ/AtpI family protein [Brevibacillus massiliensis]